MIQKTAAYYFENEKYIRVTVRRTGSEHLWEGRLWKGTEQRTALFYVLSFLLLFGFVNHVHCFILINYLLLY